MNTLVRRTRLIEVIVIAVLIVAAMSWYDEVIADPSEPVDKGEVLFTPGEGVVVPCVFTRHQDYRLTVKADFTIENYIPADCDIYSASYALDTRELIVFNVRGVGSVLLVLNDNMRFTYSEENQ